MDIRPNEILIRLSTQVSCGSLAYAALLSLALGLVVSASLAASAHASQQEDFELLGTWYVLVHYADLGANGSDPATVPTEAKAWEDKVWSFEAKGSRLVWTEYSAVVFGDNRGRSESLAGGRKIRSEGFWRPSRDQAAEIEIGLSINPQWARSKTLSGDTEQGFRSRGAHNRESSKVIGYSERWEIAGLGALPVFIRVDEMTSARSEALDGKTEYRSESINRNATRLKGTFSRDGAQQGSFTMMRSGPTQAASVPEDEQWKAPQ
ncbi:MAG: hypothetical protein ACI8W3_002469 [Myxococcota bacterium]|jgi:hypothetical protein